MKTVTSFPSESAIFTHSSEPQERSGLTNVPISSEGSQSFLERPTSPSLGRRVIEGNRRFTDFRMARPDAFESVRVKREVQSGAHTDVNSIVVSEVNAAPGGTGYRYSTGPEAFRAHRAAMTISENGELSVDLTKAKKSFCSAATHLLLGKVLSKLQRNSMIFPSREQLEKVLPHGEEDGVGFWGRVNANGPGFAILMSELGAGTNFWKLNAAKSGDFVKVYWNKHVGVRERGHLGVFMGWKFYREGIYMEMWSANVPNGFSKMLVKINPIRNNYPDINDPTERIPNYYRELGYCSYNHYPSIQEANDRGIPVSTRILQRALFTRITHPENITANIEALPPQNNYLVTIKTRDSNFNQALEKSGAVERPRE